MRTLPCQCEHASHIFGQMLSHLNFIWIVFDVIVAIGKRQAALIDVRNDLVSIMQIRVRIEIEERIRADQVNVRDLVNKPGLVFRGRPMGKIGITDSRAHTGRVYPLALRRTLRGRALGQQNDKSKR